MTMKDFRLPATCLILALTSTAPAPAETAALADPLALPTYEQTFEVEFATPEDAARATCALAPLPDNARLSFGTRWDDTNDNDLPKAEMLNRAGAKGSFYLVGTEGGKPLDEKIRTIGRAVLDRGHAVGNHTDSHPFVLQFSPNGFLRQILRNRIRIERNLDCTVNSYVSPYGWRFNAADREQAQVFARLLVATGHYVSGDNPQDELALPRAVWYPAHRFAANDRKPSEAEFRKNSAKHMKKALADADAPRLTLGTHAWCDAAGNEIQCRLIRELCEGKPWVQQNDWEFGSYRYEAINARVEKRGASGNRATFAVRRFRPSALSAALPLSLVIDPAPTKGLEPGGCGTWKLPHADGLAIVSAVDETDANGRSALFPGLVFHLAVNPAADTAEIVLTNGSDRPLTGLYVVFYAPPVWQTLRHTFSVETLAPGETFRKTVPLGARARADYAEGAAFAAASVDFAAGGKWKRLWTTCDDIPGRTLPFAVPRDAVRASGYLPTPFADAALAAMSVAAAELPTSTNWKNDAPHGKGIVWYAISSVNKTSPEIVKTGKPQTRYFVWDFAWPKSARIRIGSNASDAVYCNGRRAGACADGPVEVELREGPNRIIVGDTQTPSKYTPVLFIRPE